MMNIFFNKNENRVRAGWRIAGQFFLAIIIGALFTSIFRALIPSNDSLIFGISMLLGTLISTWAATRGLDKRLWTDYGLQLDRQWLKECGIGLVVAAVAVSVIFIIEYAAGWLTISNYGWQAKSNNSYLWAFVSYFLLMVCVGFYEELTARGYQIVNLAEGLNLPTVSQKQASIYAAIISSLLFGILHWGNPNATLLSTFNISIAGLMLAFPFLITDRLSYSIGLHIGWNFFQGGIFGFSVSGLRNGASLILINQTGPAWLTGGSFGPEAGLLGLLGMILIIGLLIAIFKIRRQSIGINNRFSIYHASE